MHTGRLSFSHHSLERGIDSAIVFYDLSAAFDTLDHEDILNKMKIYGFTEGSVAWYRSYLSNRYQYVMVGGSQSCHSLQRLSTRISLWDAAVLSGVWGHCDCPTV